MARGRRRGLVRASLCGAGVATLAAVWAGDRSTASSRPAGAPRTLARGPIGSVAQSAAGLAWVESGQVKLRPFAGGRTRTFDPAYEDIGETRTIVMAGSRARWVSTGFGNDVY